MAKILNWIIVLCGLWEAGDLAAIFVPGFGPIPVYLWNHIIVGILLVIAGAWAALTRQARTALTLAWVSAVLGGWLMVATLVLRPSAKAIGLLNDMIVGAIVVILGIWAALARRGTAG